MSTLRAILAVIALLLALPPLMLLQWLALATGHRMSRVLPVAFHRFVLSLLGVRLHVSGPLAPERPLLIVANHVSWLDIVTLTAVAPVRFVSKAEVARWPVIGWLARLQRTVFLDRGDRSTVGGKAGEVIEALRAGDLVVVFPEGTTSDGNRVLPFKSGLLGAVRQAMGDEPLHVQPLSICHTHLHGVPIGRAGRHLGAYPGRVRLIHSLQDVLTTAALDVHVDLGPSVPYQPDARRKAFAAALERRIRRMHAARMADARLDAGARDRAPVGSTEAPRAAPETRPIPQAAE